MFDLNEVSFRYPDAAALCGVTLSIAARQRIALLGANGSGKSTLLRLLDGLAFAESGTITFNGKCLTSAQFEEEAFAFDFRRRVALVFQNPDVQLFNPTVFDELAFAPLQLRWPNDEIRARIADLLQTMGLAHLAERAPHRLSEGEKKRVALASVMITQPDVLLLDEPTASLDPRSRNFMIEYLLDCRGRRTVITATHDLHILEEIADYCFVLHEGRLVAAGAPNELLADEKLLRETGLVHAHRHRHEGGVVHSHPHDHHSPSGAHRHS
ncbi:MAG: ABC transporter ATP-binding protein [Chthoniobacterales bacterium]|nr:ABC transporter ATP-binding protein [Chthoniobacterales bacterium]